MRYYRSTETGAVWTEEDMRSEFKGTIPEHWQEVSIARKRSAAATALGKVTVSIVASALTLALVAGALTLAVLAVRWLIGAFS